MGPALVRLGQSYRQVIMVGSQRLALGEGEKGSVAWPPQDVNWQGDGAQHPSNCSSRPPAPSAHLLKVTLHADGEHFSRGGESKGYEGQFCG